MNERLSGVLCPVITPFDDDLIPDPGRLVRQCEWLLSQNVGLAVFGTNSEANSLSVDEKIMLLDHLVEDGIDVSRMMPGTGCCALTDTVQLTKHAVELGCAGVLMLPPFYYKDVTDSGLYRAFAEVIERVGNDKLRIYLYHIPPISQVAISLKLIDRLTRTYPGIVVGVKDSSGDWDNTKAMLERGWDNFSVFAGAETFLLQTMQAGGAGCISATANVNPAGIDSLYRNWNTSEARTLQQRVDDLRNVFTQFPMIPALKATVAHFKGDEDWKRVRPPLEALSVPQTASLVDALNQRGFELPGL